MKIILRKDLDSLGKIGDIMNVADGYARNYLIPKSLAAKATREGIKAVEIEKRAAMKLAEKEREKAQQLAERLEKLSCTILVKVGENDRLFGSVTNQDIARQLKEEGFSIGKKQIDLETHIKELGVYKVPVKLGSGVVADLKVWVVKA